MVFTYKAKLYETYTAIINAALKLKGKEQKAFVKAYADSGKFALSNIGYVSGYYDRKTAAKILKAFSTAHPISGKTVRK